MKNVIDELNRISQTVYCQLKPSKYHGVGVFAIRDIPKGTKPFEGRNRDERFYKVLVSDLKKLPVFFADLIKNYSVREKDYYWVTLGSWNTCFVQDFLNHSVNSNVIWDDNTSAFRSARKIKKGEELMVNYKDIDDSWRKKLSVKNN